MPTAHKPRAGSLQFWPRKRAKRQYPRIRSWADVAGADLLGFAGYKAGMTHAMVPVKDGVRAYPSTIIECPPLKPFSLRFYQNSYSGSKIVSEILAKNLNKELKRKVKLPKKAKDKEPLKKFDEVRLVVYTQPHLTGLEKKKPEIFEIKVSNKNVEFLKSLLEKEIKIGDVIKEGQFLDVHSVTKGKGFQGPVKRSGIGLKKHKSEKGRRGPGSLGAWTPKKVTYKAHQAGQLGYQTRTEYNKQVLKIGDKPEDVNPKKGFPHYGLVKNDYILIKGSVAGPVKRLIRISGALRKNKVQPVEIKSIRK